MLAAVPIYLHAAISSVITSEWSQLLRGTDTEKHYDIIHFIIYYHFVSRALSLDCSFAGSFVCVCVCGVRSTILSRETVLK